MQSPPIMVHWRRDLCRARASRAVHRSRGSQPPASGSSGSARPAMVERNRGSGRRNPELTIQSPAFVRYALSEFRHGQRPNEKMRLAAQDLSDTDIMALSTYIARLDVTPATAVGDASAVQSLATKGDQARGIPACTSCHLDLAAVSPSSRGWKARRRPISSTSSTTTRLLARANLSALNPMPGIASALTAEEREGLASWFASRTPGADRTAETAALPQ